MRAGDTFSIQGVADRHLWVILSDPETHPDRVIFVLQMRAPVTPELLDRIRRGVSLSREIPFKFVERLIEQGVID